MTWQGSGTGAPGEPDDDATRTDIPVPGQPAPPPFTSPADDTATAPVPEPPSPFAPGGPLADDAALGATSDPSAGGAPLPPPAGPPDAPPAGLPPAPAQPTQTPWAAPVAVSGGWGTVPSESGRFAVPGAPGLVYAGAGPRFLAYVIDLILIAIVATIVTIPFAETMLTESLAGGGAADGFAMAPRFGIGTIIQLVIDAAYFSLLWASAGRATIGMRLLKLQVGDATTGNRIPIATAFRRWLAFGAWVQLVGFVPVLAAVAGLAVFAWQVILLVTTASHPQKMGLHDRFANTAMVRPANAGNTAGIVIGCLVILIAVAFLSIVALIFLGGQVSAILSTVGESRLTDGAGDTDPIGEDQRTGLRDMDPDAFRAAAHEVVDLIADYLAGHRALPGPAADRARVDRPAVAVAPRPTGPSRSTRSSPTSTASSIPNATHWQHPGFLAYFATTRVRARGSSASC